MTIAAVALIALVLWGLLAVGLRAWIQLRQTGSTGIKGISGPPGSAEWVGGVLFVVANAVLVAAPILVLAGAVAPIGALDGPVGRYARYAARVGRFLPGVGLLARADRRAG
jgi:hypothetical protein